MNNFISLGTLVSVEIISCVERVEPLLLSRLEMRQLLVLRSWLTGPLSIQLFIVAVDGCQFSIKLILVLRSQFSILKQPFLYQLPLLPNLSLSTLDPLIPLTFVKRIVIPMHLPESMP